MTAAAAPPPKPKNGENADIFALFFSFDRIWAFARIALVDTVPGPLTPPLKNSCPSRQSVMVPNKYVPSCNTAQTCLPTYGRIASSDMGQIGCKGSTSLNYDVEALIMLHTNV